MEQPVRLKIAISPPKEENKSETIDDAQQENNDFESSKQSESSSDSESSGKFAY